MKVWLDSHLSPSLAQWMTKDADFLVLLERLGPPPPIVWVTCGNTSNARMRELLRDTWPATRALLDAGEPLVEIADR